MPPILNDLVLFSLVAAFVSLRLGPPCKVSFDDENCAYGQS